VFRYAEAMRYLDKNELADRLGYAGLIDALRVAFREHVSAPPRSVHRLDDGGRQLLVMPAWDEAGTAVVKMITVNPGNAGRGQPSIVGLVVLFDSATGQPVAALDGAELTARRTAATSALAADYLARPDARTLTVLGTGTLAPHLVAAHASVRPIDTVYVWGRSPDKSAALAQRLNATLDGIRVAAVADRRAACADADIVSCATAASEPVLHGAWLKAGAHVDLVGAYSPQTRECDDDTVAGAAIYVDARAAALAEAGDLLIPMSRGVIAENAIRGDLADLCRAAVPARGGASSRTVFKSVGLALEDLAAARLACGVELRRE
jgi:ornithine cyclodeaminase